MNPDFKTWWDREGKGLFPSTTEAMDALVEHIAELAWDNGAFKALESASAESIETYHQRIIGSATIMHQGYIIELADGGPWLKNDLTWTPIWDERGVWHEIVDAELAMARSLSPNDKAER